MRQSKVAKMYAYMGVFSTKKQCSKFWLRKHGFLLFPYGHSQQQPACTFVIKTLNSHLLVKTFVLRFQPN